MAGLPPGDPQLVSMIVNHLKTQGLFDQFRRDCLADVDTKPAYLNLKQRVDNFVSNHLSNHTWSPHLNKNQLRNNIRQLVLQSGMLEQGVDRIVAQVVDPKINHTFRPQVERVVQEFLSPGSYAEEPPVPPILEEEKPSHNLTEQASVSAPTGDAMSILDTITTLNQEASCWASSSGERSHKGGLEEPMQDVAEGEQDASLVEEGENGQVEKLVSDVQAMEVKMEDDPELTDSEKEGVMEEMKMEDEDVGTHEQTDEGKDKDGSKALGKPKEEGQVGDAEPLTSPSEKHHIKQKARERLKEEYSLEDSDLEGLSDITVSSVHTSDLSSLEDESDDELPPSDSSEDGEVSSDGERVEKKQTSAENEEDKERKPRRQAYVHKPFLYSRYYSDSDDEVTVEQRRRSAAKDKEERLLKRQQNRERMEEKRKQRAAQLEEQNKRRQETVSPSLGGPRAKEARKEKKVLEKKMALNRKRKRDSRRDEDVSGKKKGDAEGEGARKDEGKVSSKSLQTKSIRKVSELASDERLRRKSGSTSEDSVEPRKVADKSRTHSFILDLEQGSEESLKQRPGGKFDRLSRKEPHLKERKEKERSLSDERSKLKQKSDKRVGGEAQMDESQQKEGGTGKSDDKGEKKTKARSDKKLLGASREGRVSVSEAVSEEGANKKGKATCVEAPKVEKDREKCKEKEKDRGKEEKMKGEKTSVKSDSRLLLRDSTGSSEERSDMEPGPDSVKRKDNKIPKEALKRSKSHTEDVEKAKHTEKTKSKSDSKDGEEKKPRGEHGTQESHKSNKSNSETEKDSRKSRETEPPMKGKSMEKSRSKSREDLKVASSSRMDKKAQGTEVKSKGGALTSKPDTPKDRKKEGSVKQNRRGSEENPPEKTEDKSAKKVEKMIKIPEKKGEARLDDRRGRKGEDKSEKSSVSSPAPELGESLKISPQPKDASADSDPTAPTTTTSTSDDTYDALSDITPEPEDDDAEKRLSELEPCALATESDALLTLVDLCTSEDARLGKGSGVVAGAAQGGDGEDAAPGGGQPCPELAFQDADMKMKEAALTLLSMDPDSTVSSDVVDDTQVIREETLLSPQQMETTTPQGREQQDFVHVVLVPTSEASPSVRSEQMDEPLKEPLESQDVPETKVTEIVVSKEQSQVEVVLQEDVVTLASTEQKTDPTQLVPESEPAASVDNITTSNAAEMEGLALNVEGKTEEMVMEHEEHQVKMDSDNISEDQNESLEEVEGPVSMKSDAPEPPEEARETRRGRPPKLVKQASNASKSDGQEDERGSDPSEKEDKTEGRVTRKRRLSSQKATMPKDLGDKKKEREGQEEPPKEDAEETDAEKATEPRTPRRGRSSKSTADQEEQPQEPEKAEETVPRRGRRSGAQAKETSASNQKKDEEPATVEKEQNDEEEKSEPKRGGRRGRPARPPAHQPDASHDAESSESKEAADIPESGETADTCKPAVKRKRSEDSEDPEETDILMKEIQPEEEGPREQEEKLTPQDSAEEEEAGSPSTEEEHSGAKTDEVDKEQPQKKPVRRGRASKGSDVASEDSEKKETADDEKEGEEEEEGQEEEEETKRRTTTRSASRLEAERNKPSKPSTRASRLGGKEESAANTRGARGQAAVAPAKIARKREASPSAPRTRGGQKSDEPPSKRAKR